MGARAHRAVDLVDRKNLRGTRMSFGPTAKLLPAVALAAASFTTALVACPGNARAEGPVSATGKGIAGGALLGGEVVGISMGAAGVQRGWPYLVFCPLGAVAGGVGGYFVEKTPTAEPSLYMLAGGLALLIPTLVVTLNATSYRPPESDRQEPANNEPAKEAPRPTGQRGHHGPVVARAQVPRLTMPHLSTSIVDVYQGKLALGAPAIDVRPLYSSREMWQFGVTQGSEVRFPLFQTAF
jgi:hypothetical protein